MTEPGEKKMIYTLENGRIPLLSRQREKERNKNREFFDFDFQIFHGDEVFAFA